MSTKKAESMSPFAQRCMFLGVDYIILPPAQVLLFICHHWPFYIFYKCNLFINK